MLFYTNTKTVKKEGKYVGVAYNHTIKLVTLIMSACFGVKRVSVGKGLFPLRCDAAVATAGVFIRQTDWLTHLTDERPWHSYRWWGVFLKKLLYSVIVTKKVAEMTGTEMCHLKNLFSYFYSAASQLLFQPTQLLVEDMILHWIKSKIQGLFYSCILQKYVGLDWINDFVGCSCLQLRFYLYRSFKIKSCVWTKCA